MPLFAAATMMPATKSPEQANMQNMIAQLVLRMKPHSGWCTPTLVFMVVMAIGTIAATAVAVRNYLRYHADAPADADPDAPIDPDMRARRSVAPILVVLASGVAFGTLYSMLLHYICKTGHAMAAWYALLTPLVAVPLIIATQHMLRPSPSSSASSDVSQRSSTRSRPW